MAVDQAKLEQFLGRFVTDFGATMHAATVVIGDKLGLYRALAATGPTDGAGLAAQTSQDRRLIEEWLHAQYVSGYCEHDPEAGTFWLSEEQAAALADNASPALVVGAMTIAASLFKDEERLRDGSRPAGSAGTSTTTTCSTARSGCSSPATTPT